HQTGAAEEVAHRPHRLVEVGEQDGGAADVDLDLPAGFFAGDDLLDLLPHRRQVEVFLPEPGDDLCRFAVLRYQETAHALRGVDLAAEELEILLVLGQTRIGERHRLQAGTG